jgi:hypothetical protein
VHLDRRDLQPILGFIAGGVMSLAPILFLSLYISGEFESGWLLACAEASPIALFAGASVLMTRRRIAGATICFVGVCAAVPVLAWIGKTGAWWIPALPAVVLLVLSIALIRKT